MCRLTIPITPGAQFWESGRFGMASFCLFVRASHSPAQAIPAFARKYGRPCSAATACPSLNNFGQVFKDNGFNSA